jgi:tetratricopeptide (TPR) repeat protein
MLNKSIILFVSLILLIFITLQINIQAQRNPNNKERERIENRIPQKEERRPGDVSGNPQRHKQTEYPKNPVPPPPANDNINPQMPGPVDEKFIEHQDIEIVIVEEVYYEPIEFPDVNFKLEGIQKYKDGEYPEALEYLTIAIEADTNDYELYNYRGLTELKIHFYEEAENDFTKYLEYFFYEPDGYFQRGLAKFYLTEKEEARKDFEVAADMGHKQAISILKRFY